MNKFLVIAGIVLITLISFQPCSADAQGTQNSGNSEMGNSGSTPEEGGGMRGYYGTGPNAGLSESQVQQLNQARQQFFQNTQDLRNKIAEAEYAIRRELNQNNPDSSKLSDMQKQLSQLRSQYEQQAIQYQLQVKKIVPNSDEFGNGAGPYPRGYYGMGPGMMGGYGGPGQGYYGMGPGMMGGYGGPGQGYYGMGPGMMGGYGGPGQGYYGMGPGMMGGYGGPGQGYYGMGPGMMGGYGGPGQGYGMGPGMMGGYGYGSSQGSQPYQAPEKPLNKSDVQQRVQNYLDSSRNPNLKIGEIKEQGNQYEVSIVTQDGSLVDRLLVNKDTGLMRPAR